MLWKIYSENQTFYFRLQKYQFGSENEMFLKNSKTKVIQKKILFNILKFTILFCKNPTEEKIAQEIKDLQEREKELIIQRYKILEHSEAKYT